MNQQSLEEKENNRRKSIVLIDYNRKRNDRNELFWNRKTLLDQITSFLFSMKDSTQCLKSENSHMDSMVRMVS